MVLFGATGDLAKRLVMPALYNLSRTKVLPEKFALIGVGRTKETAESWGGHLYDMLKSFVGDAAAELEPAEMLQRARCSGDGRVYEQVQLADSLFERRRS
jgi:glucose-6-phosphate 1-dehydrogenase